MKHRVLRLVLGVWFALPAGPLLGVGGPRLAGDRPSSTRGLTWGAIRERDLGLGAGSGGRAWCGLWIRWSVRGQPRPRKVRVRFPGAGSVPGAALTRIRPLAGIMKTKWIHRTRRAGDDVVVEVEVPARHRFEVCWVPLAGYEDWTRPYRLEADPRDPGPRGDRRPLVLVHGLMFSPPQIPLAPLMRRALTDNFRRNRASRALRPRFKVYQFLYPTLRGVQAAGVELVRAVRELYPGGEIPAGDVVLVGHSLGGLVCRVAINLDDFGSRIQRVFTLATPHHGSLIASLAGGNWHMREKIPEFDYDILRTFTGMLVPDCQPLADLWWDDHDGGLGRPEYVRFEIPVNRWLRDLNATDAHLDRLTVYTGDCPSMRWPPHNLVLDYVRWAQGAFGTAYQNSDPLVPFSSGSFEGAPVARRALRGVTHLDWVVRPGVLTPLIQEIADLPDRD